MTVISLSAIKSSLFDRAGRNDFDADLAYPFVRPVRGMGGCGGDFLQHVIALGEDTETGVMMVQERGVAVANKKLAAGRIGVVGASHRKGPALMRMIIEFG